MRQIVGQTPRKAWVPDDYRSQLQAQTDELTHTPAVLLHSMVSMSVAQNTKPRLRSKIDMHGSTQM